MGGSHTKPQQSFLELLLGFCGAVAVQCEAKATARNGSAMKVLSAAGRARFISDSEMVPHRVTRTTLVVLVLFLKVSRPRIQQC